MNCLSFSVDDFTRAWSRGYDGNSRGRSKHMSRSVGQRSGTIERPRPSRPHGTTPPLHDPVPAPALRLHGEIARRLGIAIVSGRYAPGDLLDNEIASSEQLEVSRTAYREAVRILAAKGLVQARPKIGTRVNPRSHWSLLDPDVLEWIFDSGPDRALLNSLFELRRVIECAAAGFAARRRNRRHLKVMRSALARMAEHTLATPRGRAADLEFHATLLDATANPFLISLTAGVSAAIDDEPVQTA